MISYRPRSALRDMGRALGIDLDRINAVSKGQQWWDGRGIAPERLAEQGFDPDALQMELQHGDPTKQIRPQQNAGRTPCGKRGEGQCNPTATGTHALHPQRRVHQR